MIKKVNEDQADPNRDTGSDESGQGGLGAPVLILKLAPSRNFPKEIREFIKAPVKITLEPENRAWLAEDEDNLPQLIQRAKTLELVISANGGPLQDQANQKFNYKISQFRLRLDHRRLEQRLEMHDNAELESDLTLASHLIAQNKPNPLYSKMLPAMELRPFFYLASIVDVTIQMEYKLTMEKEQRETLEKRLEDRGAVFNPAPKLVPHSSGVTEDD